MRGRALDGRSYFIGGTVRPRMAIDKTTGQRIVGTIAFVGLLATIAVARKVRGEHQRPYPTPGYEYVPENPKEKDPELS